MLSYRHAFHAGNFADLLKHTTLVAILEHLCEKPGAVHYIETHAGAGKYRLDSQMAQKTGEFNQGIGRLWHAPALPGLLGDYLRAVQAVNHGELLFYPGSPLFAAQTLRQQDRLHLCELHNTDFPLLQQSLQNDRRATCYHEDGYKKSLALVPPLSKRGLVMIDPSYEVKSEYQQVVTQLKQLHKRFATGVYALWYPVIDATRVNELSRALKNSGIKRIQRFEFGLSKNHETPGMNASGMIVINPPWRLKQELEENFTWLIDKVYRDTQAYWLAEELVGE
ncbi:23S rRNA (adenine(2030)-N(6))-methyltransferase RlmJ [Simiduia curdlanivorans]|uniref:Ribosomal RNA large subunit methyltransferase J n=1 Tax=Simiduia curdlanivorans TaxID=1492769 RepID=A0ABV8V2E9_9GAMM|nr:23S rRNA (adenine(2030)-N(6))-methyltransferase RlmJ [Simiduia curdlanivorans]MDN3640105.1 23S rRNA (adenine(2030)-N(6))-methyltransferase RlmJ [Simiduia curdlanivorans]